ncbi:MAG: DUF2971 domain-containing protein [Bacteroidetes bacterium]|nr:DUF2971 domain-containing protein [Bacteroidota bacterium]
MSIDFFKKFYNDDIIYHYTKASTAINFILYNKELKFSESKKSTDPIESCNHRRVIEYSSNKSLKSRTKKNNIDANEVNDFISNLEKQFYQICFCKNSKEDDSGIEYCTCEFKGNEELFGFTKLRMWDQYADKYKGVCIALSKKKILALNSEKLKLIEDDLKYLSFDELSRKKMGDIQVDYLERVGKEKYKDEIEKRVKKSFFYKHQDYKGEDEYRIGTLYDKKNCSIEKVRDELIFDKPNKLKISGCIEAIFVSSFANEKQKEELLEYAKHDLPIIEMKWKDDSFKPRDYREWMKIVNKFQNKK